MAELSGIISKLTGSAGQLTFRRSAGRTIVSEKITQTTDRKTSSQMRHRMKWPNLIMMYKGVSPLLNMAYENKAQGVNDYNMFVKLNLANSDVYLTKSEVNAYGCVAYPYQISQGSITSIKVSGDAGASVTDIALGDLALDENTTIAQFSNAVVQNNLRYNYGDQIAFIYCYQTVDEISGAPRCEFHGEYVVLDKSSDSLLYGAVSALGFSASGGCLACNMGDDFVGAYAWVHSRKDSGSTLVSSQKLICANDVLLAEYTGDDAYERAVDTYGGENSNFLTPDEQGEGGDTPTPVTTKVKLTLIAGEHGSVDPAGTTEYEKGTVVTIRATSDSGYQFDQWSDGNYNATRTITMDADTELTASFEAI